MSDIVTYKGHTYRCTWRGDTKYGRRCKLEFMDGSKSFWADEAQVGTAASRQGDLRSGRSGARSGGKFECEECGEYVTHGTRCWETGCLH